MGEHSRVVSRLAPTRNRDYMTTKTLSTDILLCLTTHFVGDMWRSTDLLEGNVVHFGIIWSGFLEMVANR